MHLIRVLCTITFLLLLLAGMVHAFEEVRFLVIEFRPYTHEADGTLQGSGMERLQKIMKDAGIPCSFVLVSNTGLAEAETRQGRADGIFPVARAAGRDAFASYFGPVVTYRWCWYVLAESTLNPLLPSFKPYARSGSIQDSRTLKWLKDNAYRVTGMPASTAALLTMLDNKKVNSILVPEPDFDQALSETGASPGKYRKVVLFESPLGIYLSRAYLDRNPGAPGRMASAITGLEQGQGQ
ncbi:MAG TPA: hypothetical protein PLR71_08275 [Deltaproteobacteria bacterium]|nr:hypothetical protein [Deltaproteobacteria bacterium]HQI81541.1 hypothetical protein [Deltaproteobacteria bacterium]